MQKLCLSLSLIIVLCSACGSKSKSDETTSPPSTDISATTNPDSIVLPRPDHLVIIIDENHKYSQIIGSPDAPFITAMSKNAAVFTNSHGVTHPSQGNYLAFFSGSVQNVTGDEDLEAITPFTTPNLGAALLKKGYTFKGYAQGLPNTGSKVNYDSTSSLTQGAVYGRKHCPWVNWQGDKTNNFPDTLSRKMADFPTDFNSLPTVAFVIPDMDNDMHNIGNPGDVAAIKRGDDWIRGNLGTYINWASTHNSMLILTFDEDDMTAENRIPTLIIGPRIKPGEYSKHITHFDILRTIERMFDLPRCNPADTSAHPIKDIWN